MLPGRRSDNGSIFVIQGTPPEGTPLVGGIALSPLGAIYINGGGAWSPLDLFAQNEQGAWYDPSDLSTMFQDSAGTTPVTADGQPVGLILDKSKGLVLGPELLEGTFESATAGSVVTPVAGGFTLASGAGGYGAAKDVITIPGGKPYFCEFDYVRGSPIPAGLRVIFGLGTGSVVQVDVTNTTGHKKVMLQSAPGGNVNFAVQFIDGTVGATGTFTNLTVKELAGNHASQATTAKKPLYKTDGTLHERRFDGVDDDMVTPFNPAPGASCTIARSIPTTGAQISTSQTVGTSWTDMVTSHETVVIDRTLTQQETTDLTAYLNAKAGL